MISKRHQAARGYARSLHHLDLARHVEPEARKVIPSEALESEQRKTGGAEAKRALVSDPGLASGGLLLTPCYGLLTASTVLGIPSTPIGISAAPQVPPSADDSVLARHHLHHRATEK